MPRATSRIANPGSCAWVRSESIAYTRCRASNRTSATSCRSSWLTIRGRSSAAAASSASQARRVRSKPVSPAGPRVWSCTCMPSRVARTGSTRAMVASSSSSSATRSDGRGIVGGRGREPGKGSAGPPTTRHGAADPKTTSRRHSCSGVNTAPRTPTRAVYENHLTRDTGNPA